MKSPERPAPVAGPRLTEREKQVLELLLRGLSDKMVGDALGIGYGGTRRHVDALLQKYRVTSVREIFAVFLAAKGP